MGWSKLEAEKNRSIKETIVAEVNLLRKYAIFFKLGNLHVNSLLEYQFSPIGFDDAFVGWELPHSIGSGASSIVYKALLENNSVGVVAVKVFKNFEPTPENIKMIPEVEMEMKKMKS